MGLGHSDTNRMKIYDISLMSFHNKAICFGFFNNNIFLFKIKQFVGGKVAPVQTHVQMITTREKGDDLVF